MKSLIQRLYLGMIYTFLYLPILVLIVYSANNAKYSMVWKGASTIWYRTLFQDSEIWSAFLNSVLLGITASVFATVIGLLAAVQLFLSQRIKKYEGFMTLLLLLIIIPDLVLGVALLIFFNYALIPLGFFSLFIAHVTFCLPFVLLTIFSRIETIDMNIYLSAVDLGATRTRALTKVLLPLLFPSILSALLLAFTLSFDDVVISYFVAGPEFNILPLAIYSMIRAGITPEVNALGTLTLVISFVLVMISAQLTRKAL
ncbi:MAG: ABC transporter permease subunit [Gammaproteobacteria bacterium]|nr:ABC transporter permease subunit [Gammaproteobacteria bacterium]